MRETTTTTSGLTEERVPHYRLEVDSNAGNHPRDLTDPARGERVPENVGKEAVAADLEEEIAPANVAVRDGAPTAIPANLDHVTHRDPRAEDHIHPATVDDQVVEETPGQNVPEEGHLPKDEEKAAEAAALTVRLSSSALTS
jgi:hypothetical protein